MTEIRDTNVHFHQELAGLEQKVLGVVDRAEHMVEMAPTHKLFTTPSSRMTEDYITGRFG